MADKQRTPQEIAQARADSADRYARESTEARWIAEGLYLTDDEKAEARAIWDKYYVLMLAAAEEMNSASITRPDVSAFYQGISPDRNPDEWRAANKRAADAIRAWEASAPQEWKDAQDRLIALNDTRNQDINAVTRAAYQRQYEELTSEPGQIVPRAKEQVERLITDQHSHYKAVSEKAYFMSAHDVVALGGKEWKLDAAGTRKRILEVMRDYHFRALGNDTQAIDEIKAYIEQAISTSPYIAPEGTPGVSEQVIFRERPKPGSVDEAIPGLSLPELTPDFTYGPFAAMPTSKLIQNQLMIASFNGRIIEVDIGGEGKEKAIVKASITTDRELTPEAVEIQNVIGELIQANGNRPIRVSRAQIWRALAGLEDGAKVTEQNQEYVGEMIGLLAEAKGRIDFTEQVEKHKKLKKDKEYDYNEGMIKGPLVMADETRLRAGGHETKGFILYRQPLFYLHSHLTNQITRIDRALLDTTTEKITDGQGKKHTAETRNNDLGFIMLKRHLARQVARMKRDKAESDRYEGRRAFDGICKAIGLDSPTPKQTRTLRADIELLCRRWKIQGHIKGYSLYTNRGSRAYAGVQIQV